MTTVTTRTSARDRLLAAASDLFYDEGVHTVGIDRVIERAGVAKATLYSTFGSKDELVRAYLEARSDEIRDRVTTGLEAYPTPREKLVGVFEIQAVRMAEPSYRGCAFVAASAESPAGSPVEIASDAHRSWMHELFLGLARQAGVRKPKRLAQQLVVLYDGVAVSARMDRDPTRSSVGREIAVTLIEAALP